MNEDENSNPNNDSAASSPDQGLEKALEILVSHAPFRAPAQYDQANGFTAPGAGACPSVGEWFRLAAGDLSPQARQTLLSHAALCTGCLARLRESQSILSADATAEESEEVKRFSSISPQWQRRLALQLAQTESKSNKPTKFFPVAWIAGGVAAALVLLIVGSLWWRQRNSPERLLAEAYSQSRTFDLRVPDAAFAAVIPSQHLRGGASDHEPVPLLSARAALESKLQQSPNDPHLLQLQARAQVLEEHYDQAVDTLDRLLAAGPVTASLLLDDGMAYYLRGAATGSENDRATALDSLRRADELAPTDPVVLFNEAIVMEERGQVMNAVETWNRYLKFERDPKWLEEGRQRLASLESRLNRIKSHESRMQELLATPQAMRALAFNTGALAGIDEELSTSFLPQLLDAAFPVPVDRSRGSPCLDQCLAARVLLKSLATSLQHNHQDPWLSEALPFDPSSLSNSYRDALHSLAQAIDADDHSDYAGAERSAEKSRKLFRALAIEAGEDRAEAERIYAEQRSFTFARCEQDATALLPRVGRYPWIRARATAFTADCSVGPGAASSSNPFFKAAFELAHQYRYPDLELRARNGLAAWAYQSGDNEDAWRLELDALQTFYAEDLPPFRAGTFMDSLAVAEEQAPRVRLGLLIRREELGLFELSHNAVYVAGVRNQLINAALRAGSLQEAKTEMSIAQREAASRSGSSFPRGFLAESELELAGFDLDRRAFADAASQLDAAHLHLAGSDNWVDRASYAAERRGELSLALGHPDEAESTLREAILTEELRAHGAGRSSIVLARQDRALYAALAGVWLAEARPGPEILALWERYRSRILGKPVPQCPNRRLDCLAPAVEEALRRNFAKQSGRQLIGQIVLRDRTLLYSAEADRVVWKEAAVRASDLLSAVASLDHVVSTPTSSQPSIDQASRRTGDLLFDNGQLLPTSTREIFVESDPQLGNLPWAAVQIRNEPIGLRFDLEELPSLLLEQTTWRASHSGSLIIGASNAAGDNELLPEALNEARLVADGIRSNLLLARDATEPNVAAHLASAPLIHFAGHAQRYEGETHLLLAPSGKANDQPYLDESLFRRDPPRAARLIVFSACSTGKREDGWDHGMGDIVDTLTSLGVPEVVATRWQIDSASAVPMMDVFYRSLSKGMSVPRALTAARQSLIRDARYRHPYYWAAYYASGLGTTDLREVFHGSSN
jgi:tetratricopeptide (TPR) repeat protein